jgi:hypothetical protein
LRIKEYIGKLGHISSLNGVLFVKGRTQETLESTSNTKRTIVARGVSGGFTAVDVGGDDVLMQDGAGELEVAVG